MLAFGHPVFAQAMLLVCGMLTARGRRIASAAPHGRLGQPDPASVAVPGIW